MLKKITVAVICLLLAAGSLAGCGHLGDSDTGTEGDATLKVVTTIFPEYDWVRQIIGDRSSTEITLLLDNGMDLHSYQPSADDMISISTCDVFVYVGGASDGWVADALREATNQDMVVVNLLEVLGDRVKEEEKVEGMQEEDHEEESETEYDEHVWLSLKNAQVFCTYLADRLGEVDPENMEHYRANAEAYVAQLQALDAEFQAVADAATVKTVLFGDRFPFRYMTDDYGLTYYAAFAGCSAETEASFETIAFLAKKVDELQLSTILTLEGSDQKIGQTILQNTREKRAEIRTMDSMQSVAASDVTEGATYLAIMEQNLSALESALR